MVLPPVYRRRGHHLRCRRADEICLRRSIRVLYVGRYAHKHTHTLKRAREFEKAANTH